MSLEACGTQCPSDTVKLEGNVTKTVKSVTNIETKRNCGLKLKSKIMNRSKCHNISSSVASQHQTSNIQCNVTMNDG